MLEAFRIFGRRQRESKRHRGSRVTSFCLSQTLWSIWQHSYWLQWKTGDFTVYTVREVVDEVFDSRLEISLKDALAINSAYELGEQIKFEEALLSLVV